jgi:hypothetical protein
VDNLKRLERSAAVERLERVEQPSVFSRRVTDLIGWIIDPQWCERNGSNESWRVECLPVIVVHARGQETRATAWVGKG